MSAQQNSRLPEFFRSDRQRLRSRGIGPALCYLCNKQGVEEQDAAIVTIRLIQISRIPKS